MNVFRLHGQRGTKQPNIASIIIKSTRAQKKRQPKNWKKKRPKIAEKKIKGACGIVLYIYECVYTHMELNSGYLIWYSKVYSMCLIQSEIQSVVCAKRIYRCGDFTPYIHAIRPIVILCTRPIQYIRWTWDFIRIYCSRCCCYCCH